MSRNDPRTQRGLAVARRMNEMERQRQVLATFERGMSELAWLGSRLSAADLQTITAADARGGLAAVRQVLAGAGLTEAGFAALDAQYQRGGLQVVGSAVQAQIQHEAAISTEQEAATALEGLRPEQWQAAAQTLAAGGPEALYREAVALGLPPTVAARAVEFVATSGVEEARRAVAQQAQARARAESAQAAAQRDLEAAQKDPTANPLASEQVQQAALGFYAAHAEALEAAGVGARSGESPAAWLLRVASAGDAVAPKVAQATNTSPEFVARLFADSRSRAAEHEMVSRVRASDAAERKARALKPQHPEGDKLPERNEDRKIREAMKRASEAMGLAEDEQRLPANSRIEMQIAAADEHLQGREPGSTFYPAGSHGRKAARELHDDVQRRINPEPKPGIDGALERASAYLEGRSSSSETTRSTPERTEAGSAGRMSIDQAISAADKALNGGSDDE